MTPERDPSPYESCYFYGTCPSDGCDTCGHAPPSEDEYIEVQRRIFREEFYEYVGAFDNDD